MCVNKFFCEIKYLCISVYDMKIEKQQNKKKQNVPKSPIKFISGECEGSYKDFYS